MYVLTPTTTTTLRDFTIEHVRVAVMPQHAHTTALALLSGMLPPAPISTAPDADRLNTALRWFGTHLYPVPTPDNDTPSIRRSRMQSVRRCVERLADTDTACVLDLVVATHTAAVQQRKGRRDTAVCGFATLSVSDTAQPYVSLRGMRYGDGQLCIPFGATNSTTTQHTLDELRRAVKMADISPDHTVPLTSLAAGRRGSGAYPDLVRFAHHVHDDDEVWAVRPGPRVGDDIAHDALMSSLWGIVYYRVFKADTTG